ncbi:MAG: RecQ family ATP-dependent DNA helicase, partial [Methanomicrobiales archaeon]|nr:RecQ family ATP-dependent DNA helicase [Methanomicrobiales archaeon]
MDRRERVLENQPPTDNNKRPVPGEGSIAQQDPLTRSLVKWFGYDTFLPLQREIIADVISGRDVLAVLPTGGGKSLCYQLPSLISGRITLVISPLIALMRDQVTGLRSHGIPAEALFGTISYAEEARVFADAAAGKIRVLYLSPERAVQEKTLRLVRSFPLGLIAIDEAHCISMWGHQFRPEYQQLGRLRDLFPGIPMLALTATATPRVREEIVASLRLRGPAVHLGSFLRENLAYLVDLEKDREGKITDYIIDHPNESGIVYCGTRDHCETISARLRDAGVRAFPYHAGFSNTVRAKVQDEFSRGAVKVVCATVAFGMGVDKSDIRFVIHAQMPKDLESYYQETGRGGRDGAPCTCILFYQRRDRHLNEYLIRHNGESPLLMEAALARMREMEAFCTSSTCRRAYLLHYFHEPDIGNFCGGCDVCL